MELASVPWILKFTNKLKFFDGSIADRVAAQVSTEGVVCGREL